MAETPVRPEEISRRGPRLREIFAGTPYEHLPSAVPAWPAPGYKEWWPFPFTKPWPKDMPLPRDLAQAIRGYGPPPQFVGELTPDEQAALAELTQWFGSSTFPPVEGGEEYLYGEAPGIGAQVGVPGAGVGDVLATKLLDAVQRPPTGAPLGEIAESFARTTRPGVELAAIPPLSPAGIFSPEMLQATLGAEPTFSLGVPGIDKMPLPGVPLMPEPGTVAGAFEAATAPSMALAETALPLGPPGGEFFAPETVQAMLEGSPYSLVQPGALDLSLAGPGAELGLAGVEGLEGAAGAAPSPPGGWGALSTPLQVAGGLAGLGTGIYGMVEGDPWSAFPTAGSALSLALLTNPATAPFAWIPGVLGGAGGFLGGLFGGKKEVPHKVREAREAARDLGAGQGFVTDIQAATTPQELWNALQRWSTGYVGGKSSVAVSPTYSPPAGLADPTWGFFGQENPYYPVYGPEALTGLDPANLRVNIQSGIAESMKQPWNEQVTPILQDVVRRMQARYGRTGVPQVTGPRAAAAPAPVAPTPASVAAEPEGVWTYQEEWEGGPQRRVWMPSAPLIPAYAGYELGSP